MEFITILLPIFLVFGIGFTAQKILQFDTSAFSKLALYILVPFLVFQTFYEETITFSYVYISIYMLGLCAAIIVIVTILSKVTGYSEKERCGLVLSCAFTNNGNYGTPLVLFLFGTAGMDTAIVLMVLQQLLMSTLGVYYAAKGGSGGSGVKAALRSVRRMPMVYGALIGYLFQAFDLSIGGLENGVDLIAGAAIPLIMLTLGMQLANINVTGFEYRKVSTALIIKLIAAPAIAAVIVWGMPVDPLMKQIMIIMAATPTAANTTMYAIQFQTEPQTVTSSTLFTTLVSILTIPVVIYLVT
ncbi:AEC family transporter [Halobacillus halophilus]|uniref:AEC family transporter n=1 Tax=Halobacillus TaxID=45667 RepID=UPI00136B7AC8|nr:MULTISPECIES: AEC family transporter [Halobacillus]MCA1021196.1 AEC family transporter [Halobacillus litoralis]MYL30915.1 AEC family transporter [Halobacillus halophilus]